MTIATATETDSGNISSSSGEFKCDNARTGATPTTSYGSINANARPNTAGTSGAVCIAIEAGEKTPLLVKAYEDGEKSGLKTKIFKVARMEESRAFNCKTIAFLTIILTSVMLGAYLLWQQSLEPDIDLTLNLVPHDLWSTLPLPTTGLLDHHKVENVLITHTGGESCTKPRSCRKMLNKMQNEHKSDGELHYNFIVGGDGETYEARGWDYKCGIKALPQETALVVAFLGNYTDTSPGTTQLNSAYALILESLKRKKLLPHYQLYALCNTSRSRNDGEGFFNKINQWPNYKGILQFL